MASPASSPINPWILSSSSLAIRERLYSCSGRLARRREISGTDQLWIRAFLQYSSPTLRPTIRQCSLAGHRFAAAPLGAWLETRARIAGQGKAVIYATFDYFADGEPVGRADAILKSSERRKNNPDQ